MQIRRPDTMLATVIDLPKLGDAGKIAPGIQAVMARVQSPEPAPWFDEVPMPGDPERRNLTKRMADGVEADDLLGEA